MNNNQAKKAKKPKSGTYIKGQETATKVLEGAEKLLLERGYHSLSLRNMAMAAGVSMSNLQYYFPNKDDLIKALLDKMIQTYLDDFEKLREQVGEDPEEQFVVVMTHVISDLNNSRTTSFFPEFWALANHTDHVTELMDDMYARYRHIVEEIIENINPALTREQVRKIALFITSSIEGHTVFIGHNKPWKKDTPDIIKLAIKGFLHLIKNPPI